MLTHRIMLVLALVLGIQVSHVAAAADGFQEAKALHQQGKHAEALTRLEALLEKNPRDARARFLKGVIFSEQDRTAEAISVFTGLTQDFPEMAEPYNNLAVLHASQGNYSAARDALEMALRVHPGYATAHENLGDVQAALARESYARALELDPDNQRARTKLSRMGEAVPETAAAPPPQVSPPSEAEFAGTQPEEDPAAPVLSAVESWAQAWSRGDAAAYLAHYAPSFQPPGGQSRAAWESERRKRLDLARGVSVNVLSPEVAWADEMHASVRFRQDYTSQTFRRTTPKTLHLVKDGERWLIERELATD